MADPKVPVGGGDTVEGGVEFLGEAAVAADLGIAAEEEEAAPEAFIGGEEEHPVDDTAEAPGTVNVADEVFCAKFVQILFMITRLCYIVCLRSHD